MGLLPLFLIIAAPFVGSFLGLLAIRLPAHEDIVFSRSKCQSCGTKLAVRDLIPIASYALAKGQCRSCHAAIPITYPLIEIGAVVVAVAAVAVTSGWLLVVSCLLGWTLLTLTATDLRVMILPNVITLPLIPIGLGVSLALPGHQLIGHVIGALAGGSILWLTAFLYERLRGKAGLGMGDVKLFAAAGAWLGWQLLPYVMLLASLAGLVGVVAVSLTGRKVGRGTMLPFGAALAPAFFAAWLFYIAPIA